jgi:high affinity Mn2+ porin
MCLQRGSMVEYSDAVAFAQATGQPADINAVRTYTSRPGVSLNVEQQVNDNLGVFFRAGWADGHKEPWDFTDIDLSAGRRFDQRQIMGPAGRHRRHWGLPPLCVVGLSPSRTTA